MKSEQELIEDKLAYIRDHLLEPEDFVDEDGWDLTGSFAGSPYEVLCAVERKLSRQKEEIANLDKPFDNDIHFDPPPKRAFKLKSDE